MSKFSYDLTALRQVSEFDAAKAVKNFPDESSYFDALTVFCDQWHSYLYLYNPTVVAYSDDMQKSFLEDVAAIRKIINPLELTLVSTKLEALMDSLHNHDAPALTDGLKVFFASLKITSNRISETRMADPHDSSGSLGQQPVILAVDDKPELLTAISGVLQNQYKVIAVTSGRAALKVLDKHTPSLFLLDIEMPVMDGYELARQIRAKSQFKTVPILFLTSKTSREHVISAIKYGGNDYLIKPVDSSLLIGKIQHHLSKNGQ